ncbi:MAG: aminotransferase class I/II-fold pyridoxal phosphate-dependent enzyme, partial [Ktedonobacteraceae bacterium]
LKTGLGAAFSVTVEGIERLVLVHEVDRGYLHQLNADEVIAAMRLAVAKEHGLLAAAVCLVKPWQLPRTSSGKVQRFACREHFTKNNLGSLQVWSSLPRYETQAATLGTLVEQQLARAIAKWLAAEIAHSLALQVEDIAPDQPFVRYGVNSIEAINIACALEIKLDCALPPTLIWDYPSIALLAEHLAHEAVATHPNTISEVMRKFAREASLPTDAPTVPTPAVMSFGQQQLALLNERYHLGQATGNYFYQPVITQQEGAWVISQGRRMLMMASYSYLGLLGHPRINAAAQAALMEFGTGTHGVRLLAGTISPHRKLEQTIARFKQSEDAVVFTSGYVTNIATIATLASKGHVVICDQLNHASIIDGCTLSQAQFVLFRHNDMDDLARCLRQNGQAGKQLVAVDAVFSMDGDIINLPEVVRLCKQHGAFLMVDEAHSVGVLGATGHGIEEHFGLDSQAIDVKMGTLSKALPSVGGYVAGKAELITALKHNARPFIFSAALPPPQIAAAQAALELIEEEPQRVTTLQRKIKRYLAGLA